MTTTHLSNGDDGIALVMAINLFKCQSISWRLQQLIELAIGMAIG